MASSPRQNEVFAIAGRFLAAGIPAALFVFFLVLGIRYADAGATVHSIPWVPQLGVSLDVLLDGFSLLFALIITGIGALVVGYAGAWFDAEPRRRARFIALILCFMIAMLGAVLADNLIVMFVFWEATSLLSFLLIGFDNARAAARKAALQSLIVTAGGGLALFAGILLIGIELGTYSMSEVIAQADDLARSNMIAPIAILIMIGAFTKSAQFPFQFWLPNAMEAPTPASAYLHSATMVKLGVYILARFDRVFESVPLFGAILVAVGTLTMAIAIVQALAANDYKRVLAHSTVGALAFMVMLIGLTGDHALEAMVTFLVAHVLYKAALFLCAGSVTRATHEYNVYSISGLRQRLPLTALGASLAAVSMAGIPPTMGFFGKEAVLGAQLEAGTGVVVLAITLTASIAFVAIAGIAGVAPFVRQRTTSPTVMHEPESRRLTIGPILLGIAGVLFGLMPGIREHVVGPATSALTGTARTAAHHGTALIAISVVVIAVGAVLYAVRTRVHRWLARRTTFAAAFGDRGYEWLFDGTIRTAGWWTRFTQNGDQRQYTGTVLLTVVLAAFLALVSDTGFVLLVGSDWPSAADPLRPGLVIVLLLMVAGAVAATLTQSLLRTMIAAGAVGFGSACVFLMNGAPDLALTQFAVEVLMVVLFTALLLRMPVRAPATRTDRERRVDTGIAIAAGVVLFVTFALLGSQPLDRTLSDYYGETSRVIAHGRNVVNVIIVDYRGLDTLGEITVVALAAVGVWGILRRRRAADVTAVRRQ